MMERLKGRMSFLGVEGAEPLLRTTAAATVTSEPGQEADPMKSQLDFFKAEVVASRSAVRAAMFRPSHCQIELRGHEIDEVAGVAMV